MRIKTWQERLVGLDRPTDFAERSAAIAEAGELRREVARHNEEKEAMNDKQRESLKMVVDMHHDLLVVMQAAVIEWRHGKGAEAALNWIVNTLDGPGLLPIADEPYGKEAQAYFDANQANPMPKCFCGRPSNQGWMGQGFCSTEHYQQAKAASLN